MNMQNRQKIGATMLTPTYSSVPLPGSPSHTEAWALTEAARRIAVALQNMADSDEMGMPAAKRILRDALRLNWRLWTIFQAELTLDTNPIPFAIRQNMLILCQFVDNHTIKCLGEVDPEDIKTIIDINRNIAQGLLEGAMKSAQNEAPESKTEHPGNTLSTNI